MARSRLSLSILCASAVAALAAPAGAAAADVPPVSAQVAARLEVHAVADTAAARVAAKRSTDRARTLLRRANRRLAVAGRAAVVLARQGEQDAADRLAAGIAQRRADLQALRHTTVARDAAAALRGDARTLGSLARVAVQAGRGDTPQDGAAQGGAVSAQAGAHVEYGNGSASGYGSASGNGSASGEGSSAGGSASLTAALSAALPGR